MLRRDPGNPILTRAAIPDVPPEIVDATSVFNPGAVATPDGVKLMLRVQSRGRETHLLMAVGETAAAPRRFRVEPKRIVLPGLDALGERVFHLYDPRITELEGAYHILFAMDMASGCRLGLAITRDFERYEFLGAVSETDTRNGVLFPQRFGGRYLRLERPNRVVLEEGLASGEEIWLAESRDLRRWAPVARVMRGRPHYWDERIGSGPPPIRTRAGWLHLYHGVATHFQSVNIYQAGVSLLDLEDPSRLIARCRENILEPREPYELAGQVPNVVFPSGAIVEQWDAEGFALPESPIHVYYGAADTCVGRASATVGELVAACLERNVAGEEAS